MNHSHNNNHIQKANVNKLYLKNQNQEELKKNIKKLKLLNKKLKPSDFFRAYTE